MPSTVADVLAAAGVSPAGVVRWRTAIPQPNAGVYVVALTDDIASNSGSLDRRAGGPSPISASRTSS